MVSHFTCTVDVAVTRLTQLWQLIEEIGMCRIGFFRFGFGAVFEKKTWIMFGMSLVQFSLKKSSSVGIL